MVKRVMKAATAALSLLVAAPPAFTHGAGHEAVDNAPVEVLRFAYTAGQAMDGKGQIDIQTAQRDGQVCLRIRDTGRGMPPDQLERLFDFDFKATDSRVKVGFGLYTAHAIVPEHEGTLTIKSQEGKGTEVAVCLPLRPTDRG